MDILGDDNLFEKLIYALTFNLNDSLCYLYSEEDSKFSQLFKLMSNKQYFLSELYKNYEIDENIKNKLNNCLLRIRKTDITPDEINEFIKLLISLFYNLKNKYIHTKKINTSSKINTGNIHDKMEHDDIIDGLQKQLDVCIFECTNKDNYIKIMKNQFIESTKKIMVLNANILEHNIIYKNKLMEYNPSFVKMISDKELINEISNTHIIEEEEKKESKESKEQHEINNIYDDTYNKINILDDIAQKEPHKVKIIYDKKVIIDDISQQKKCDYCDKKVIIDDISQQKKCDYCDKNENNIHEIKKSYREKYRKIIEKNIEYDKKINELLEKQETNIIKYINLDSKYIELTIENNNLKKELQKIKNKTEVITNTNKSYSDDVYTLEETIKNKDFKYDGLKKEFNTYKTVSNNKIKKLQNELDKRKEDIQINKKTKTDHKTMCEMHEIIEKYKIDIYNSETKLTEHQIEINKLKQKIESLNEEKLQTNELEISKIEIETLKQNIEILNKLLNEEQLKTNESQKIIIEKNKHIESNIMEINILNKTIENNNTIISNDYSIIMESQIKINVLESLLTSTNDKLTMAHVTLQQYEIKNKELFETIKEQEKYYIF